MRDDATSWLCRCQLSFTDLLLPHPIVIVNSLSLTTTVLITTVMHRPITHCLVFHSLKRVFQLRMVSDKNTSNKKFYLIKTVFVGKKIKFVYPGLILQYPDKSWSQLIFILQVVLNYYNTLTPNRSLFFNKCYLFIINNNFKSFLL